MSLEDSERLLAASKEGERQLEEWKGTAMAYLLMASLLGIVVCLLTIVAFWFRLI